MRASVVPGFILSREALRQKVLHQRNQSPPSSGERGDCDRFLRELSNWDAPDTKGLRQQAEHQVARTDRYAHGASRVMQAASFTVAVAPLIGVLIASYTGVNIGLEAFGYVAGGAMAGTGLLAIDEHLLDRGRSAQQFCNDLTGWEQRLAPPPEEPAPPQVEQPAPGGLRQALAGR